jgi:hypothetical protein
VLFWGGVIGIVREWRYSRRHGVPVSTVEKLYLLLVMPAFFGMGLLIELTGVPVEVFGPAILLAMCLALNAWPIARRLRRA